MYKPPEMNYMMKALSAIVLAVAPERTGLVKLDYKTTTRNRAMSEYLEKDPLVEQTPIYIGNVKKMMETQEAVNQDFIKEGQTPSVLFIQGQKCRMGQGVHCV